MRLTIAYSKIKKGNIVLINNATYQRETLSERPIRQPLRNSLIGVWLKMDLWESTVSEQVRLVNDYKLYQPYV